MDATPDSPDTDPLERTAYRRRRWRVTIERGVRHGRVPRAALSRVLATIGPGENAKGDVRVIVVDNRVMRRLNRRFRKRDRPTDVLAFPSGPAFPLPLGDDLLGEVYCNLDHAREWARTHGGTLTTELARLAVHGCLHLLGYRHRTLTEQRAMTARENRYLSTAGLLTVRLSRGENRAR